MHIMDFRSVSLKNTSLVEDLVTYNLSNPNGVAVDWCANNLYWTDSGRGVVEVARLERMYRKIIISVSKGEVLGALAIYPQAG